MQAEIIKYYEIESADRLFILFERQRQLQNRIGTFPLVNRQEFINVQSLALIDEVMEALRETPWKPWKKKQEFNEEAFKSELIDAWHFLINLSLAADLSADELYTRFIEKNKENHKRQENGY